MTDFEPDEQSATGSPQPTPTEQVSPPLTAEMMAADPRITYDVIELTEPFDPGNTFET